MPVTGRAYNASMSVDDSLHELISVWPHEGHAAELVCKLKYRRATVVVSELAQAMAEVSPEVDFVTWVPASPSRRRQRGFDQGELLARALARRRRVRVRRLLRRSDDDPQTGRDRDGRVAGARARIVWSAVAIRPHDSGCR